MSGSNMYGYSDYNGPTSLVGLTGNEVEDDAARTSNNVNNDEEEHNPLQVGFWMEGDSLAPPCGSSISTIHCLLQFASVTKDDVVYDLGCGDARVCLEAFALYRCKTIGIEIEQDLVDRANELISRTSRQVDDQQSQRLPRVLSHDLRQVLDALVIKATENYTSTSATTAETLLPRRTMPENLADLPLPTLIVMYLLPEAIELICEDLTLLLRTLPNSFRIVCNTWGMKSLQKIASLEVQEQSLALTPLMLYTSESL